MTSARLSALGTKTLKGRAFPLMDQIVRYKPPRTTWFGHRPQRQGWVVYSYFVESRLFVHVNWMHRQLSVNCFPTKFFLTQQFHWRDSYFCLLNQNVLLLRIVSLFTIVFRIFPYRVHVFLHF